MTALNGRDNIAINDMWTKLKKNKSENEVFMKILGYDRESGKGGGRGDNAEVDSDTETAIVEREVSGSEGRTACSYFYCAMDARNVRLLPVPNNSRQPTTQLHGADDQAQCRGVYRLQTLKTNAYQFESVHSPKVNVMYNVYREFSTNTTKSQFRY